MALAFPPNPVLCAPSPVKDLTELSAILNPSIGDRRFVRSVGFDYQFVQQYVVRVDANNNNAETLAYGVAPIENTNGVWVPSPPGQVSSTWIPAAIDRFNWLTFYRCKLYGGTVKSIYFEADEPGVIGSAFQAYEIPDFDAVIAGTSTILGQTSVDSDSGFYDGPTVYARPRIGNKTALIVVNVDPNGEVLILNCANSTNGAIRRVKINGLPVDPVILSATHSPDPLVLQSTQIIYHTGTLTNPSLLVLPAIAVDTSLNKLTHRWDVIGQIWVALA